jgi:hypothetical protein
MEKGTPLTEPERRVLAAYFGGSNSGLELSDAHPGNEVQIMQQELTRDRFAGLESSVFVLWESFAENEGMIDSWVQEAQSWYKDLRDHSREYVTRVWPRAAALVWPQSTTPAT